MGRRSAKALFEAARAGNPRAVEVVRHEAALLAHLVAAVMAILDPEPVVFGGGVGSSMDLLGPHIDRTLRRIVPFQPRLSTSELGEDAIVLGAIARSVDLGRQRVFADRTAPARRPISPAGA